VARRARRANVRQGPGQHPRCRRRRANLHAAAASAAPAPKLSEAEAKRAWLARLDVPTWGKGQASAPAATAAATPTYAPAAASVAPAPKLSETEAKRAWLTRLDVNGLTLGPLLVDDRARHRRRPWALPATRALLATRPPARSQRGLCVPSVHRPTKSHRVCPSSWSRLRCTRSSCSAVRTRWARRALWSAVEPSRPSSRRAGRGVTRRAR